ncbi:MULTISPECIES: AAA family ATPase [unclassified Sinorhizobium]|uniref:Lon protease family protein n=1 Tax=unclassified Sinorhizobium TaxID=2613772 RepID=UPI0024C3FFDE|nr:MULTISPECIES: AAA family ATPase [unclassified Sinorhizobium]MDK1374845.1 AAA family ATPase [Sinorhizobium sp. 6-70]MDK1479029.1 AAA family ATPase [Sinorhizobium sp. 6-117]
MRALRERLAVQPQDLRRRLDPATLPFQTTAEVSPVKTTIGQPRAAEAIAFALEVGARGFHLYAAGSPGTGRESTVLAAVRSFAAARPTPPDWVYVHNFAEPDRPRAFPVPAGKGRKLAKAMTSFVEAAQLEIPGAFEGEDYARRREEVLVEVRRRRAELIADLRAFAQEREFALEMGPTGIAKIPLLNGEPMPQEAFEQLPPEAKAELEQRGAQIQAELGAYVRKMRQVDKEAQQRVTALDREVALLTAGPLIAELREDYDDQPDVLAFLEQIETDLPDHLHDFLPTAEAGQADGATALRRHQGSLARYEVNVLIDNSGIAGAPVVLERNPTYYNLSGRLDYRAVMGTMVTDFLQIRPGALHRANGGFLVLHALDVMRNPFAWEGLKRALASGEVVIENPGEQGAPVPTNRPRPEPIPLDVKVILIGPAALYQALHQADVEFPELFGVKAEFAPDMDWNEENLASYSAFLSLVVRDRRLLHFDRSAVARIVEHGARLRDHQRKLTTRFLDVARLAVEACHWAGKAKHKFVLAEDVDAAVAQQERRRNLAEERMREVISDGTIMIDTEGARVAQVNGVSVLNVGDYSFGQPSRVTARVSVGRGTVQSIEREIELSGPIHAKGFLILTGYLQAQYAQDWPLSLGATITFEQSYGGIDGDSASTTELYALLSALSGLPLNQGIAVTGAVNQHGQVQAVGGVTRKIEGFYDVCRDRGLTGRQGVIVPTANVMNLMLKEEVVEAVRAGRFHVWAVSHVDEGIELLMERTAGEPAADGTFPEGTVHRLVQDRLRQYAEHMRAFGSAWPGGSNFGSDGH